MLLLELELKPPIVVCWVYLVLVNGIESVIRTSVLRVLSKDNQV